MTENLGVIGKRILELGCGKGRFTFELARYAEELFAIDISKVEIDFLLKAKKIIKAENIRAKAEDVFNLHETLKGKTFDNIVGFFILHHLLKEKYDLLIRNLTRLIKKRGKLCFIEPNNLYPFHLVEMLIMKDMTWEIEKGIYTNYLGCFKKACQQNGFRLKLIKKFGFVPPPLINFFPTLTIFDKIIERIPLLSQVFCPFVLIIAEKK